MSPQARRDQIKLACQRGLSPRRACGLLRLARSTLSYELRMPAKDAPVMVAMKALPPQYPRYGYRRIRVFLYRERAHLLGVPRAHVSRRTKYRRLHLRTASNLRLRIDQ